MAQKRMRSRTSSLLRYPGSKSRFAPFIADVMRLNGINSSTFIEPFCGGASVSISMLDHGIINSAILNDADPLISSLWMCVFSQSDSGWLADQVMSIPLNTNEWTRQRDLNPSNIREAALKGLYLNRTSFNGILHKSGPIGGWGQTKRSIGVRFNREALRDRILELSQYSSAVQVSSQDWQPFLKSVSKLRKVFFYLDPPYYYKAERLYGKIFSSGEHIELHDYLVKKKLPWLLSYDDATEIRALYSDEELRGRIIDSTYSTHPLGGASFVGRELVYTNLRKLPELDFNDQHIGITVRSILEGERKTGKPLRIPYSNMATDKIAA